MTEACDRCRFRLLPTQNNRYCLSADAGDRSLASSRYPHPGADPGFGAGSGAPSPSAKTFVPTPDGACPNVGGMFIGMMICVILIVGGLTVFPNCADPRGKAK